MGLLIYSSGAPPVSFGLGRQSIEERKGDSATRDPAAVLAFGLGGNLGDVQATLRQAIGELRARWGSLDIAPLYRTAPVSPIPQADFLNTVVLAALPNPPPEPAAVLRFTQTLERRGGRRPGERFGPRPLDVDLLLFGDRIIGEPGAEPEHGLVVPHPRMRQRRFVLAPLADLDPGLPLPPDGAAVRDLLRALGPEQEAQRIEWPGGVP